MASKTPNPAATSTPTSSIPNDKTQLLPLISQLEKHRNTRVIVYWLLDTARISEAAVVSLYDQVSSIGKQPAIDLVLFTRGGDTEVPWRIVTLMREYCDKFSVLLPYRAYSAGTLLAMGADEIVMTPLAVLGPIDPSRTHPLLPRREGAPEAEPISVQDMRHAMRFILETAKLGGNQAYTPDAMAQIVAALFDKIHPLAIGAIEQSYALAKLIGTKCLSTHMNPDTETNKIDKIVNKLCDDFKSHSYQICRSEARAIGLKAIDAPASVDASLIDLLKFYSSRSIGLPPKPTPGQIIKMYIGWIDSSSMQIRCEADAQFEKDGKMKIIGDRWVNY